MNSYYPRRSGQTTWMYIRAIARLIESDEKRLRIVFPKLMMAKFGMDQFAELIQRITNGACEVKVIKSQMKIEFLGKEIIFDGLDRPRDEKGCKVIIDEFKDHTCFEEGFKR